MSGYWKLAGAIALGAGLALLPFLQFGVGHGHSHSLVAHADHSAAHGGRLTMVGDFHVEVVEADEEVRVYVSDSLRRPLRPSTGTIRFDGSRADQAKRLRWRSSHLVADRGGADAVAEISIDLDDGETLEIRLGAP